MQANNFNCSDKTLSLLEWMRSYANTRINSSLMDARRSITPHIILDFGNRGLLGLQAPTGVGGLDLNNEECMSICSQIGAIDLNLAIFVGLHNFLGLRPIMNYSNKEICDELLPLLASGRELSAFGLTEPGAGSNAIAIQGTAVQMPDGKLNLNGSKMWIGNASWASVINVFMRCIDENGKPNGVGAYVIKQGQAGLNMGPELMTMGLRGMVQNTFTMTDLIVDAKYQLGSPGDGLNVAQDAMMHTRLALGAIFLGSMKRCIQLMCRYAERRKNISTGRLLDNPISMIRISSLLMKTSALESLVIFISRNLDNKITPPEEFLISAKVFGSEFLWDAADSASQMLGGRGYLENNEISKILRDARVGRVFEGPTETMWYYMGTRFFLENEKLLVFFKTQLGSEDIASKLIDVGGVLKTNSKTLTSPFNGIKKMHLANSLMGEILGWGILYAVTRSTLSQSQGKSEETVEWLKINFENCIERLIKGLKDNATSYETEEILRQVKNFETSIGDLQQTLPGEDWILDAYLQT